MTTVNDSEVLFEERQNTGANKSSLSLRIFLALFCLTAYFLAPIPEISRDLFLFLGLVIILVSVVLLSVTHIHTRVCKNYILLEGFGGKRKVKIRLDDIIKAEKSRYSSYFINNPAYNLHRSGVIKFYTGGKDAIRLTDREGLEYLIGTHKPEAFLRVVLEQLKFG